MIDRGDLHRHTAGLRAARVRLRGVRIRGMRLPGDHRRFGDHGLGVADRVQECFLGVDVMLERVGENLDILIRELYDVTTVPRPRHAMPRTGMDVAALRHAIERRGWVRPRLAGRRAADPGAVAEEAAGWAAMAAGLREVAAGLHGEPWPHPEALRDQAVVLDDLADAADLVALVTRAAGELIGPVPAGDDAADLRRSLDDLGRHLDGLVDWARMHTEPAAAEAAHLRSHAGRLAVLRRGLSDIRTASLPIRAEESGFGSVCGWILTGLGDRFTAHDRTMVFVIETLDIFVDGLNEVAAGVQELDRFLGDPVEREETEPARTALAHMSEQVARREWVEPLLAGTAPVAPAPLTARLAVAYVPDLQRMLDDLSGTPDVVARQAVLWAEMAGGLRDLAADLHTCLRQDFPAPDREDLRRYVTMVDGNAGVIEDLAAICDVLALITRSAGELVLRARDLVRALIAGLFTRVIGWVGEPVVPLPVLAGRLGAVVTTAWLVHRYLTELEVSIATLSSWIDG